jgi:hypothetical protein
LNWTLGPARWELAGLCEAARDLGELRVLGLGYARQDAEGRLSGNAMPFYQDALGLPDNVAGSECLLQLLGALLSSEGEGDRGERGQQSHDPLVELGEGRDLVDVQDEGT